MKKYIVLVFALIFGIKYGVEYIFSPKFQAYGDRTKAPWTCEVDNFIGHMLMVVSHYEEAKTYFEYTIQRCPDTAQCEVAEYEVAESWAKMGHNREATDAYRAYAEKYKGTKRAKIADQAADLLHVS